MDSEDGVEFFAELFFQIVNQTMGFDKCELVAYFYTAGNVASAWAIIVYHQIKN